MMLTTKGRYAVMAMVDLAINCSNGPVKLEKIAERQEITINYLEQILAKLRKKGLITSVKGPGGGYAIKGAAAGITIAAIIEAVDESIKMTRCENESETGCLSNKTRCLTHDLWEGLSNHIYNYLNNITLADVYNKKLRLVNNPFIEAVIA